MNMNCKDRFHNQLALNLGYERILDKGYDIKVEYDCQDDPVVLIRGIDGQHIEYHVSEDNVQTCSPEIPNVVKRIIEASHQAYIESTRELFSYYTK